MKHCPLGDDLTGAGTIDTLKVWWKSVTDFGPFLGYSSKPSKSWLIVKEEYYEYATGIFAGTGINITTRGRRHLGAVIGSEDFKHEYVESLIDKWEQEVLALGDIAKIEPHAAYSAFIHGLKHRYTYVMRTIPGISDNLERLDKAVDVLIKSLMNNYSFSDNERKLFALPPKLGGLGMIIPSKLSDVQYESSRKITCSLVENVRHQVEVITVNSAEVRKIKMEIKNSKRRNDDLALEALKEQMNPANLKLLEAITEKGASNWLTAIPLKDHDFYLDKQSFWDALYLRYGIMLPRLPSKCVCNARFDVEHALNCKKGGFITMRHNEVRDFTSEMLSEVCKDVSIEPSLVPLTGETFERVTMVKDDDARVDVSARGFWRRVFNPLAKSYSNQNIKSSHRRQELEKKRKYNDRIRSRLQIIVYFAF